MSDQFEVVQTSVDYEVTIKVVRRAKEFVGVRDYQRRPKEASVPTVTETEVAGLQFVHSERKGAIERAIQHLKVMGNIKDDE